MDLLSNFSLDSGNPEKGYKLALWYESQGHTASAHTYFLRSAERTNDTELAYACLIRAALCYRSQGSRDCTEKVLLENALALDSERPEAYYFLSKLYERKEDWPNSYLFSHLGAGKTGNEPHTYTIEEFPGDYSLLFQKAVSAWWWGKGGECRSLFQELIDNHWDSMREEHKSNLEESISRLGVTPYSQAQVLYTREDSERLRFQFPGLESVEKNHSQIFQDMFVLCMLNGKRNGTYLEIGGADPFDRNNTALLESHFGWSNGVTIELNKEFADRYKTHRPHVKVINADALDIDYREILKNYGSTDIDYLQLDIEPTRNTYECLLRIPFNDYRFAVITYEHDYYVDVTRSYRDKSRKFLQSKGYVMVAGDLSPEGVSSFEDWWVHPDLVSKDILSQMQDTTDCVKAVRDYMLPAKFYAEFDTDKFLRENFFPDVSYKGIMVEVGAGPPEFISTSKHFRDSGWRTICVDPNPKFVQQHKKAGSEIYQYACSNKEDVSSFVINLNNDEWYTPENDGVSFSSLGIRYNGIPPHNTQETIQVSVITLNSLLEQAKVDKVDILSVDVEGWELEVMEGFDHSRFGAKVIVLENLNGDPKYDEFMATRGYEKVAELGHNYVYKVKTSFNVPCTFTVSFDSKPTSWIVDNFYEDPDFIRKFALEQDFLEGGIGRGFIGRRTHKQFLFPGLKEKFESIMGMEIVKWEDYGMNGRFQIAWSGEPLVYHCDSQKWGGMLYLTPEAPYQCGTTLYAHKKTRARTYFDEGWDAAWVDVPGDCHLDGTPFEPVDVLGNVYNRLVIFDASCIHSASQYFGTVSENSRLWQMFFFDT